MAIAAASSAFTLSTNGPILGGMRRIGLFLILLLALAAVGCSDTKTHRFQVSVKNATDRPITVWLVKEGPPVEQGWRSPEQMAISVPDHEERIGGRVVPPGKTADTGTVTGRFEPHSYAWLRVYDGPTHLSEILATSKGNPARLDIPLDPGVSRIVITDKAGRISATTAAETDPTPLAK